MCCCNVSAILCKLQREGVFFVMYIYMYMNKNRDVYNNLVIRCFQTSYSDITSI